MDETKKDPGVLQYLMDKMKKSFEEPEVPLMVNGKIVKRSDYPQFKQPEQELRPYVEPKENIYVNPQEGIEDLKKVFSPEEQQQQRFKKLIK